MLAVLQRFYYWPQMQATVKEYISSCDICQRTKSPWHKPYGELNLLPLPKRLWSELTMDFITGLPPARRRGAVYDLILVVVDWYTKVATYIPTQKTITAPELAEIFFEKITSRFGLPDGIVTDRGSVFTSAYWSEFCFYTKVKRRLSIAFHPQTDGQTKQQNQILKHYLQVFCLDKQTNWVELLAFAEFAYNSSKQAVICTSPFFACYGFTPHIHFNVEDNAHRGEVLAAREHAERIEKMRKSMADCWQEASKLQARAYNRRHKPMSFKKGDLVMLTTKNLKQKGPSQKLSHRWIGPFCVDNAVGMQAYCLVLPASYCIHPVFHISQLEPYQKRDCGNKDAFLLLPKIVQDEPEYEVEEVLDQRWVNGEMQYLLKWKGYLAEYNQWVPAQDMHADDMRIAFESKKGQKRSRGQPPPKA